MVHSTCLQRCKPLTIQGTKLELYAPMLKFPVDTSALPPYPVQRCKKVLRNIFRVKKFTCMYILYPSLTSNIFNSTTYHEQTVNKKTYAPSLTVKIVQ